MTKYDIVVVGGGLSGVPLVKELRSKLPDSVTIALVSEKEYITYWIASLRASVSSDWVEKVSKSLRDIIDPKIDRIVDKVISVDADQRQLKLQSGDTLEYSYLALATGKKWHDPISLQMPDLVGAKAYFPDQKAQIEQAKKILIVGAGPVGIELAGEIGEAFSNAKIKLAHSKDLPLDDVNFPKSLRKYIVKELDTLGVEFVGNCKVDTTGLDSHAGPHTIALKDGEKETFDIVFVCTNAPLNVDYLPKKMLNDSGFVKVKDTLQTIDYDNIFALADINDANTLKVARTIPAHVSVALSNIVSLINKETPSSTFKTPLNGIPLMLISIGSKSGVFNLGFWGLWLGRTVSSTLKSKGLFLFKFNGDFPPFKK